MHNYRAYMLDADRHIIDRIDLTCGDDESAKARAREFVAGHAWSSGTAGAKVATFEPSGERKAR